MRFSAQQNIYNNFNQIKRAENIAEDNCAQTDASSQQTTRSRREREKTSTTNWGRTKKRVANKKNDPETLQLNTCIENHKHMRAVSSSFVCLLFCCSHACFWSSFFLKKQQEKKPTEFVRVWECMCMWWICFPKTATKIHRKWNVNKHTHTPAPKLERDNNNKKEYYMESLCAVFFVVAAAFFSPSGYISQKDTHTLSQI